MPNPQRSKKARIPDPGSPVASTTAALLLTGAAGMGMEILWFRYFSILLGEYRAVFALLLSVILLAMGAGSLAGGYVQRRTQQPARALTLAQGLFVAATLLGLVATDARAINDAVLSYAARHSGVMASG